MTRKAAIDRCLLVFHPCYALQRDLEAGLSEGDEKVKKFPDPLVFACKGGFPMRTSDSSVGGAAGQFHTTPWVIVMLSADGLRQSVFLVLYNALVAAGGALRP